MNYTGAENYLPCHEVIFFSIEYLTNQALALRGLANEEESATNLIMDK